jgi:hypothetical protein
VKKAVKTAAAAVKTAAAWAAAKAENRITTGKPID